jgi:hypothetical protein
MKECALLLRNKNKFLFSAGAILTIAALVVSYSLNTISYRSVAKETGQRLMAIAATAAIDFNEADLEQLHFAKDMQTDAYQKVFRKLNEIRNKNPDVSYVYILRPLFWKS